MNLKKYLDAKLAVFFRKSPEWLKKAICIGVRSYGPLRKTLYKRMSFKGVFKVKIDSSHSFKMNHYGGMIENETFWNGLFKTWENDNGWAWMELCKNADSILDIGANTGIYSLVAKTLNPGCKLIAFEPSQHTFSKLRENNKLNNFDIICEKLAISDSTGTKVFYDIKNVNQTTASLSPYKTKFRRNFKGTNWEYEVDTKRLDEYILENKIDNIDLIKLDIELHEAEAIQGLGDFLFKFSPIIFLEILDEKVMAKIGSIISLKDYSLYHLKPNKVEEVPTFTFSNEFKQNELWNYLLVPKDKYSHLKETTHLFN